MYGQGQARWQWFKYYQDFVLTKVDNVIRMQKGKASRHFHGQRKLVLWLKTRSSTFSKGCQRPTCYNYARNSASPHEPVTLKNKREQFQLFSPSSGRKTTISSIARNPNHITLDSWSTCEILQNEPRLLIQKAKHLYNAGVRKSAQK